MKHPTEKNMQVRGNIVEEHDGEGGFTVIDYATKQTVVYNPLALVEHQGKNDWTSKRKGRVGYWQRRER